MAIIILQCQIDNLSEKYSTAPWYNDEKCLNYSLNNRRDDCCKKQYKTSFLKALRPRNVEYNVLKYIKIRQLRVGYK